MHPILTLFLKELRQHGVFALAMVFLCLLFQIAYIELCRWNWYDVSIESLLGIAFLLTALYAGTMAALAYSTEHAENTFVFLRKLPVSWTTVASGKVGWVLCGTMLVLTANLFLAAACGVGVEIFSLIGTLTGRAHGSPWAEPIKPLTLLLSVGLAVAEALIWGLFWSTRCRSLIHALLATCICTIGTLYLLTYIFAESGTNLFEIYAEVALHRLVVLVLVAFGAVWGMSRWFSFEARRPLLARLYPDKMTVRYPLKVQQPFAALVHQHLRHASLIYPIGVLCMLLFAAGSLVMMLLDRETAGAAPQQWWFFTGVFGCLIGFVLFWATIFGHDQKNDSYRLLSRLGISEGEIWWSRLVPALIFSAFGLVFFLISVGVSIATHPTEYTDWNLFISEMMPVFSTLWLVPVAVGTFMSVSFRSQVVAISLTFGGVFVFFFWMMFTGMLFGLSPWWATLPICIALLIASRIRAAYWIRETFTWRSRLIPLVPVVATILAIFIAMPFVRVYSLPLVSWEQIDAYFDQTELQVPREPEKRKALLQHIAEHGNLPPEYDYLSLQRRSGIVVRHDGRNDSDLTAEEALLVAYAGQRLYWNRYFSMNYWLREANYSDRREWESWIFFMPWERARLERASRLTLVAALVDSEGLQDERAKKIADLVQRQGRRYATFDLRIWESLEDVMNARQQCQSHFSVVGSALENWHEEHGSLPESLEELIDREFFGALFGNRALQQIPEHPFTGAPMEYYRNAPPPEGVTSSEVTVFYLGRDRATYSYSWELQRLARERFLQSGGTYLRLGKWVYLIIESNEPRPLKSEEPRPSESNEPTLPIL
ncbi:MAG: hypothetical protein FWE95_00920 [Planctomycetaceae bacterium]|nr:hypothetical protein [Planctomycetaceae bacterium]